MVTLFWKINGDSYKSTLLCSIYTRFLWSLSVRHFVLCILLLRDALHFGIVHYVVIVPFQINLTAWFAHTVFLKCIIVRKYVIGMKVFV